jgi:hypothetical protein
MGATYASDERQSGAPAGTFTAFIALGEKRWILRTACRAAERRGLPFEVAYDRHICRPT